MMSCVIVYALFSHLGHDSVERTGNAIGSLHSVFTPDWYNVDESINSSMLFDFEDLDISNPLGILGYANDLSSFVREKFVTLPPLCAHPQRHKLRPWKFN